MERNELDLKQALEYIEPMSLSYQEWVGVGMGLKEAGYPASVWDDWSKRDARRYHAGECARKWETFRGTDTPITAGTIVQMALTRGWQPGRTGGHELGWEDEIGAKDEPYRVVDPHWVEGRDIAEPKEWHPAQQLITYLEALFDSTENVGYVTRSFEKDGKYMPTKGDWSRTAGQLIEALSHCKDDVGAVLGDYNPAVGAWIRFNPLDGDGVKNENITKFRFALVESDTLPVAEQDIVFRKLELPIAALVHSGGKSLHAIVRVDAENYDEYRKRVEFLYDFLEKNGVSIDKQNRNPSRLSRMPGVTRNGNRQYLVATNIGRKSWVDWMDFVEGISDELPDMVFLDTFKDNPPELPEELITGILRRGHKMLISGSSKAGKSFLLMELCIAIAEGKPWLGFPCKKGRVLYVNLEIDPASAINRFLKIYEALGLPIKNADSIVVWNLRGHAVPLDQLVPKLIRRVRNQHFDAIVIDPIYKVITGDENNASEMGAFCNQFDKICTETGCSTIYCHHHSKGAQGMKKAMDRASGSGVFARDPDAQLDMIQLELSEDIANNVRDGNETAWRLESSLREFPNITPVNFWFEYPIHKVDDKGTLGAMPAQGTPQAGRLNNPKSKTPDDAADEFRTAFSALDMDGKVTVKDMAEYMGVIDKTVYARLKKMGDEFTLDKGVITKTNPENG